MQPWFGLTQPLSGWVGWIIRFPLEDWGTEKGDIDYNIDYNNDDDDKRYDHENQDGSAKLSGSHWKTGELRRVTLI